MGLSCCRCASMELGGVLPFCRRAVLCRVLPRLFVTEVHEFVFTYESFFSHVAAPTFFDPCLIASENPALRRLPFRELLYLTRVEPGKS